MGTPVARLSANLAGGFIEVVHKTSKEVYRLDFGGVGAGVGLSAIPSPVNFSIGPPEMWSSGVIYKLPFGGDSLTIEELMGGFVMLEVAGDAMVEGSGFMMFIGANQTLTGLMPPPMSLATMIASSKAAVVMAGLSLTVIPGNVGANIYGGGIISWKAL